MDNNTKATIVPVKKERIEWMDGLKGIACVLIFIMHTTMAFYPNYHFGDEGLSHLGGLESRLYHSAFRFLTEGKIAVSLFCITSGIFAALQIMNMGNVKEKMPGLLLKKYLRLMLPIVPTGFVVWLFMKFGLFTNLAASKITGSVWLAELYDKPLSLGGMLSSVFITTWFYGDDTISTAFWMMSQMFYGTFLVIILSMFYWKFKKKSIFIYIFTFVCLMPRHDYVSAFVLATIFAWMVKEEYIHIFDRFDKSGKIAGIVGIVCIAAGIILGGYPEFYEPDNLYKLMNFGFEEVFFYIGAFLIVYGIYNVKFIQNILSAKPLKKLGVICYDLLIVHIPVVFSVTTTLLLVFTGKGMSYNVSAVIAIVITIPIVIIASLLYNKYIEKWCTDIVNLIMKFLEKTGE